jgi:hypothetical protein
MLSRSLLIACVLASAGLLPGPADARPRERERPQEQQPDGWRDNRGDRGADRSAEAARRAQAANGGGRVLSVEPEGGGYRVKVLKDGEVRTHHVDSD